MRNHFLRAAAGNAGIKFVDASANGANDPTTWSTANVSVTEGQTIIFWSAGISIATGTDVIFNTTASSTTLYTNLIELPGDGGGDYLFDTIEVIQATSSGVVYVNGTGNKGSGGGLVVVSDGDSVSADISTGTGDDVSLSGISSGDILVYLQTTQFPGTGGGGGTPLTVPSGFTTTGADVNWEIGAGGGTDDWYNISTYQESPSSSVTVSVPDDFSGGALIRIYNT